MEAFVNGILFGLVLAVLIGPVFFALLQASIEKGFTAGALMAAGIALSDSIYILITWFGISHLIENEGFKICLGIAGGIIMLVFGIISIVKPVPRKLAQHEGNGKLTRQILKGFLLNFINPSVLIFWIGIISMVSVNYTYTQYEALAFFSGIIMTIFSMDVLKAYLANKLRNVVTPRFMKIMNRIVGAILILFSIKLFYYALEVKIYHLI